MIDALKIVPIEVKSQFQTPISAIEVPKHRCQGISCMIVINYFHQYHGHLAQLLTNLVGIAGQWRLGMRLTKVTRYYGLHIHCYKMHGTSFWT